MCARKRWRRVIQMVARCANPRCKREFYELGKGRLFLLPPVPDFHESLISVPNLIDHCYWLCPECARTLEVCLDGTKVVVKSVESYASGAVSAEGVWQMNTRGGLLRLFCPLRHILLASDLMHCELPRDAKPVCQGGQQSKPRHRAILDSSKWRSVFLGTALRRSSEAAAS